VGWDGVREVVGVVEKRRWDGLWLYFFGGEEWGVGWGEIFLIFF
jgi:hypothetical protein